MKTRTIAPGRSRLDGLALDDQHRLLWRAAEASCGGPAFWRHRKLADFEEVLKLAQLSGRLRVDWADLADDLRVLLVMKVSVPCLPDPTGPLQVKPVAHLGLIYRQEAIRLPQPGYAFLQIIAPTYVWHANVADASLGRGQLLCLAGLLPAGIPSRELIILAYTALTLQRVQLDALDPAGVMNLAAAQWWLQNRDRIPLSREPFFPAERAPVP